MVARRAHNPKVVGSNPAPATKLEPQPLCWGFAYAHFAADTASLQSAPWLSAISVAKVMMAVSPAPPLFLTIDNLSSGHPAGSSAWRWLVTAYSG